MLLAAPSVTEGVTGGIMESARSGFLPLWPIGPEAVLSSPSCTAARRQLTKNIVNYNNNFHEILEFAKFLLAKFLTRKYYQVYSITHI